MKEVLKNVQKSLDDIQQTLGNKYFNLSDKNQKIVDSLINSLQNVPDEIDTEKIYNVARWTVDKEEEKLKLSKLQSLKKNPNQHRCDWHINETKKYIKMFERWIDESKKKEPINWQERLLKVSEYADFIGHNGDILVRFYRDYNESMKECGHSLKTLCKRLNGQFEDDRGNKGISLYIPREELTDDTYEKLMKIEL
tara:strand:+ start:1686 stop:2273 length:588 start_codon:yes stop_codon:yes gene_type:complete